MAQSPLFSAQLVVRKTKTADFGNAEHLATLGGFVSIDSGLLADQADIAWTDQARALAASATENLDLNGVLSNELGQAFNAVRIVAIMITASPNNTNDVIIGGAATNAFVGPFGANAHTMAIKPGGTLILIASKGAAGVAGWPVTAGTGDILKVANSGAGSAVAYDIAIIGRSA